MKAKSIQLKRLEKQILRILAQTLIENLADASLQHTTFTAVSLSNDKSYLTVYVDHFEPQKLDEMVAKLNQIEGLFKSVLSQKITIHKVPQIKFVKDEILIKAQKMEQLIAKELKKIQKED